MRRREFLKRSGLSALYTWAGSSLFLNACHTEEDMIGDTNWVVEGPFDQPLAIPAVVSNDVSLVASVQNSEVIRGQVTPALTYSERILGPTIYATTGQTRNVSLLNGLNERTNIHWHGLIVPENMDGHPKDVAAPGQLINYSLPITQRAGTYWYHPHPHGATAKQIHLGLAGMFIVNDQEETSLGLPSGAFDIPLIIQDKHFEGGRLDYSPDPEEVMSGYLGEHILVNGIYAPRVEVSSGWYRFRVLNGSTARLYYLEWSDGLEFYVIGSDGGLLRSPEKVSRIMVAPGERLDLLVDFSGLGGRNLYLVSSRFSEYSVQGRQTFRIMKFAVKNEPGFSFNLPQILSTIPPIEPATAVATRVFDIAATAGIGGHGGMGRHSINGKIFQPDRVDETVIAGTTEIWEFDNLAGDEIHPMHVHGVQFQVLSRVGGRDQLIPSEKGWKDTVLVMPGEKVRVVMRFPAHTGLFVLHCHNLEHEDDGMMLNYRVV